MVVGTCFKGKPFMTTGSKSSNDVWKDPSSLATTLLFLFLDAYGQVEENEEDKTIQALRWDPETILSEIQDDFHVVLPAVNLDKLLAAILVITTDRFFHSVDDFIKVCNVFSGSRFNPHVFDPADAVECAWGMTEALLLSPPDDNDKEIFSGEVSKYVGKVIEYEGMLDPPDILKMAVMDPRRRGLGLHIIEDPALHESVRSIHHSKSEDIRQIVRTRLQLLISQLQGLNLSHGDVSGLVDKMKKVIPGEPPCQQSESASVLAAGGS